MAFIAVLAVLLKHLKISGAIAAWISGVIILYCLRFEGFLIFCIFYVSCNLVSKIFHSTNRIEKKGSSRDWIQVEANSLMALLASVGYLAGLGQSFLIMFSCSVAEACADTWAGEIGRHSKRQPVSIRNFKPVEKGTSGGISVLGLCASLLASAMIALFHSLFFEFTVSSFFIICFSAFVGCLMDSLLGATCQALYKDGKGLFTEKETDELVRGIRWIDNDTVNLMSNVFASVLGLSLCLIWN